jgi:hypothetical protein
MKIEDEEAISPPCVAGNVRYAAKRFTRMAWLLLTRRITFASFKRSLSTSQRAVCAIGGGMVFCDYADERMYFGYE